MSGPQIVYTSMDVLERMAFERPGWQIKRYGDVAVLVVDGAVWTAKIEPSEGVTA